MGLDDFDDFFVMNDDDEEDYYTNRPRPSQPANTGANINFGTDRPQPPASAEPAYQPVEPSIVPPTPTPQPESTMSQPEAPVPTQAKPHRRGRRALVIFILIVLLAAGITFWLRYMTPYSEMTAAQGYVTTVEHRGLLIKTTEGQMRVESAQGASTLDFSVEDPEVERLLRQAQMDGSKVTVYYKRYYGRWPWRGESDTIVTAVYP